MINAEDIAIPLINPGECLARILKGKMQKVRMEPIRRAVVDNAC